VKYSRTDFHLFPPLKVYIERSSVGDVPQASLLGQQHGCLAIGFNEHRLGEVDLPKLHLRSPQGVVMGTEAGKVQHALLRITSNLHSQ
jgi:hypothetical protein